MDCMGVRLFIGIAGEYWGKTVDFDLEGRRGRRKGGVAFCSWILL